MNRVRFLAGIVIFATVSRLALGPIQLPGYLVFYPGRQLDYSPPSGDEVKYVWNYGTLLFMAWGNTGS
jgi:hypothetical protein